MDCPLCLETLHIDFKLNCGHAMHPDCLKNHFLQECPLCRSPQHIIKVIGTKPSETLDLTELVFDESDSSTDLDEFDLDDENDKLDGVLGMLEPDLKIVVDGPMYEFREFDLEFINQFTRKSANNQHEVIALREALYRLKTGGNDMDINDSDNEYNYNYNSDNEYYTNQICLY